MSRYHIVSAFNTQSLHTWFFAKDLPLQVTKNVNLATILPLSDEASLEDLVKAVKYMSNYGTPKIVSIDALKDISYNSHTED